MSEPTVRKPPACDPYRVIMLVAKDLTEDKVKTIFTGREFGEARPHAEALLTALGVVPVVGLDDGEGE